MSSVAFDGEFFLSPSFRIEVSRFQFGFLNDSQLTSSDALILSDILIGLLHLILCYYWFEWRLLSDVSRLHASDQVQMDRIRHKF